jgi:hypothetical protein
VELISLYECSHVPAGHPSGLRWRPAPSGHRATSPTTAVEAALSPYEAHHLPQPAPAVSR